MAQIGRPFWNRKVEKRIHEVFCQMLVDIKNVEQAKNFVDEFLTSTEKVNLPKRLGIFIMLKRGDDYEMTRKALHVSLGTIGKVQSRIVTFGIKGMDKFIKKIITEDKPHQTRGGSSFLTRGKRVFPRKGEGEKRPFLDLPY